MAAAGAGADSACSGVGSGFEIRQATNALRRKTFRRSPENTLVTFNEQLAAVDRQNLPWNIKEKIKRHFTMPTHPSARIVKRFFRRRSQRYELPDTILDPVVCIRVVAGCRETTDSQSLHEILNEAKIGYLSTIRCRGTYSKSMIRVLRDVHDIMSGYREMRGIIDSRRQLEKTIRYLEEKI
jgi:hypothetical protein